MRTWQEILRDADPADAWLTPERAAAIRRNAVAAARARTYEAPVWPRPLALAAVVVAMVAAGAMFGERGVDRSTPANPQPLGGQRRQLQFDTPGGTRIIWIFNSDFDVKATNP